MKKFFKKLLQNCDLFKGKMNGFTLAEVLITLGIIGIVAAVTVPTLMKNYQQKVQNEKVRMVKYKLTQATSVMNTDGLIKPYPTTQDFVEQLQKYLKISKVCDHNHLTECWPADKIQVGTITTKDVSTLKTGTDIASLVLGTGKNTDYTMGLVLADGTPMILTYSRVCTPLDQYKSYPYSTQDGKPVTNATTNCISAIFDINGKSKPNKLGTDVRTLNSILGYQQYEPTYITKTECEKLRSKGLVKECYYDTEYFAGAVKKCNDIGLHLPDEQTLANIANAYYGITDITPETNIYVADEWGYEDCDQFLEYWGSLEEGQICIDTVLADQKAGVSITGYFWASSEVSSSLAYRRHIDPGNSYWYRGNRDYDYEPLCVGD